MSEQMNLFINGKWEGTEERLEVINKYTQETYATIAKAGQRDVDHAIESAEEAYQSKQLAPYERYEILKKVTEFLQVEKEEFAKCMVAEAGKPLKQARTEVDRAIQTIELSAEEAKRISGQGVPIEAAPGSENRMAFTIRVPVGVVGAITPFNFPLNLVAHKIAPALAAGNAVVLKPASATPVTALKLAASFEKAGLPAGLLNVVVGAGSVIGKQMQQDERISTYTFTGSAKVGLNLKQNTGLNKLILELGNNSPVIIDKEADLDKAAATLSSAGFAYAGQTCITPQRLYVHASVKEEFQEKLTEAMRDLVVGDPNHEDTVVGPMISKEEAKRAEKWVNEARQAGAKVVTGGNRTGAMYDPTVLTDVSRDMLVVYEEIFAPVVSIIEYNQLDECIAELNKSPYGLQGGIFTKNLDTAFYAAKNVEVGGLIINDSSQYRVDLMPYGGVKDSGWGKEGPKYAIEEMTEERLVVLNLD
ncbi:aldehyde dehydrogenase family protein [Virgibacillus sp. NKC19-3]|uniref:aldehyde dehydrogenase family protein n=1 Tax=Virgibacillus saliphilus TaxID=2831674 RepID=UPI001C9B82B1|nr:aldehyde dehydrogenase family protein [Virgibacillus sp. NKC19-3]MBY7142995.1 aldehyde dehydrogenase family protein [Virgibacillus sp. NKC19-3]